MSAKQRAVLLSFSGIDGAGKSTQIEALEADLTAAGVRVLRLAFWEDVAMLRRLRESASHVLLKGDKGVGSPAHPVNRQDKNVRSWYLTAGRLCLYLLDAFSLISVVTRRQLAADVLLFDRYIYDELANLRLNNWLVRGYVRLLLKLVPAPDVAYLLDADPALARSRKPEYPLDFLLHHRESYLVLCKLTGNVAVIDALPLNDVTHRVREHLRRRLPLSRLIASVNLPESQSRSL